jgi:hypothetical protein
VAVVPRPVWIPRESSVMKRVPSRGKRDIPEVKVIRFPFAEETVFASLIPPFVIRGRPAMVWLLILVRMVNEFLRRGRVELQFVPASFAGGGRRLVQPVYCQGVMILGWGRLLWRDRVRPPVATSRCHKSPMEKFRTVRPRQPVSAVCRIGRRSRSVAGRSDADEAGMR